MLFPAATLTVFACIYWVHRFDNRRSGMQFILWAWVFVLFCTWFPLLSYDVSYSLRVDAFVALCVGGSTVGYRLIRGDKSGENTPAQPKIDSTGFTATAGQILFWVGLLGNLLLLASAVQTGVNFSLSYLISNAQSLRTDSFTAALQGTTRLAFVGSYLAPCSYAYLALATSWRSSSRSPKVHNRWMPIATFGLIAMVALFYYAGRQPMFIAGLIVLIGFWLRRRRPIGLRRIAQIIVAAAVIFYVATSFASIRQTDTNPTILLQEVNHASYGNDWIAAQAASHPQIGSFALQFSYFSGPLVNLTYYMAQNQAFLRPPLLYGQYSFPLFFRIFNLVSGKKFYWQDRRIDVFRPMEARGFLGNVWATWLRDLYVDFGYVGAIIVASLFGAMMAGARNAFERTGSEVYHALETYLVLGMAFGTSVSLLYLDIYAYGLYILIIGAVTRWAIGAYQWEPTQGGEPA